VFFPSTWRGGVFSVVVYAIVIVLVVELAGDWLGERWEWPWWTLWLPMDWLEQHWWWYDYAWAILTPLNIAATFVPAVVIFRYFCFVLPWEMSRPSAESETAGLLIPATWRGAVAIVALYAQLLTVLDIYRGTRGMNLVTWVLPLAVIIVIRYVYSVAIAPGLSAWFAGRTDS
jgi:hypothetical protein